MEYFKLFSDAEVGEDVAEDFVCGDFGEAAYAYYVCCF